MSGYGLLDDPYAWRSNMDAKPPRRDLLTPGPTPSGSDRVRDAIYGLLGGRPENAWGADKLATAFDVGTMGMLTGAYDGASEVARGGSPAYLAAALMPGMKPVGAAAKAVVPVAKEAVQGIRAYHGSPHDFDKFDMSKLGTGEGAQAYGHGLYFAESEGVAKSYRDTLSRGGASSQLNAGEQAALEWANPFLEKSGWDRTKAADLADRAATGSIFNRPDGMTAARYKTAAKFLRDESKPIGSKGNMYEVNIKAHPDDFLDWDKPLSQQSEKVQNALQNLPQAEALSRGPNGEWVNAPVLDREGDAFVAALTEALGNNSAAASRAIQEAGIPGVKYLDRGSRTAGAGSRNYSVFDDSLIEILRKYGLLPPAALGASGMMGEPAGQPQDLMQ